MNNRKPVLTFDVLLQYIINHWINIFINILEQEWETILDCKFQLLKEIGVIESAHLFTKGNEILKGLLVKLCSL